ncbi:FAD-binding oxidoreductase [Verticiella sediminum]|uniref:FAD-binding oxidoreductase n=1 Tax=Verticiella sediminum TaxID=1247510 RepID=A0A556A6I8_9BURK|nr:FAD-binding oxidoreductase [Verticiella sediminum]TSH88506.1 FAD-binding oxidoreductase [Verticiella sediminum]
MTLPSQCDVAIIGGGIVGVCAAYFLARRGVDVAVFEKGRVGGEQSSRNWGWVRTLLRDRSEIPLALRARPLWQEIQREVDVGYRPSGMVYLARSEAELAAYRRWMGEAALPADVREVSRAEAANLVGAPEGPWLGGLHAGEDGVAEPALAAPAVAGLAARHGARIHERCAVRGLDMAGGRVRGVVTEHGTVRAGHVILAGGAWSRMFCLNHGVDFPQLKVLGSVLSTSALDAGFSLAVNGGGFTCRKRRDGGYSVAQFNASLAELVPDSFRLFGRFFSTWLRNNGLVKLRLNRRFFTELAMPTRFALDAPTPFERHRVLDPQPYRRGIEQAYARLCEAFPIFHQARIAQVWAGYIDVTPDAIPVIDEVAALPGLILASGFSGHGFGIGPAVGEALAKLVTGGDLGDALRPFRLARLTS